MQKNFLLGAAGIVLGFVVGFLITNSLTKPGAHAPANRAAVGGGGTAGPLNPDQAGGELPPGHPDIGGEAGGAAPSGSAAATSAEAQKAMDRADRNPKDFAAQAEAGQIFYNARDYEKAALYLERALTIRPKDFDTLVLAGNARYDAGRFAEAAGHYERALAVNSSSPDVRTDYGNTFFNRGDYQKALAEYRKSVQLDPKHVNSWLNIAAAALQLNDRAAAAEAVEKISELDPQSPQLVSFRQKLAEMN